MDRINIVILAEETQYKVQVKNKINDENIAIVGYADFQEESKLKIEGYFPDVIICALEYVDIDADFFKFVQSVQFQNAGCAIILMTDKVNISLVNAAAKLGIRQVVDFSISSEELIRSIKEVNEIEQNLMGQLKIEKRVRAKVIGYYGVKGGVGASTVVANTAVALANQGKKVIVFDFDLQYGDLNLLLDIETKDTIVELARDPEGISIEKINAVVGMHSSGFSLLCAPKIPEYADYVNTEHIRKIIENVRPYFEYILIDVGTNYSDTTLTALSNCDEIQLVVNLDVPCLRNTKSILNILDTLKIVDKAKFIVNKNRSSLVKVSEFENLVRKKVYSTIVADRSVCENAMNSGIPCVLSSPRTAVSKDLNKYVDMLIEDKDNIN